MVQVLGYALGKRSRPPNQQPQTPFVDPSDSKALGASSECVLLPLTGTVLAIEQKKPSGELW